VRMYRDRCILHVGHGFEGISSKYSIGHRFRLIGTTSPVGPRACVFDCQASVEMACVDVKLSRTALMKHTKSTAVNVNTNAASTSSKRGVVQRPVPPVSSPVLAHSFRAENCASPHRIVCEFAFSDFLRIQLYGAGERSFEVSGWTDHTRL
jgi:hypothetical protein